MLFSWLHGLCQGFSWRIGAGKLLGPAAAMQRMQPIIINVTCKASNQDDVSCDIVIWSC